MTHALAYALPVVSHVPAYMTAFRTSLINSKQVLSWMGAQPVTVPCISHASVVPMNGIYVMHCAYAPSLAHRKARGSNACTP